MRVHSLQVPLLSVDKSPVKGSDAGENESDANSCKKHTQGSGLKYVYIDHGTIKQ